MQGPLFTHRVEAIFGRYIKSNTFHLLLYVNKTEYSEGLQEQMWYRHSIYPAQLKKNLTKFALFDHEITMCDACGLLPENKR